MGRATGLKDQFLPIIGNKRGSGRPDEIKGVRQLSYRQVQAVDNAWLWAEKAWVWQEEALTHYLNQWEDEHPDITSSHWECIDNQNYGIEETDYQIWVFSIRIKPEHTCYARIAANGDITETLYDPR